MQLSQTLTALANTGQNRSIENPSNLNLKTIVEEKQDGREITLRSVFVILLNQNKN